MGRSLDLSGETIAVTSSDGVSISVRAFPSERGFVADLRAAAKLIADLAASDDDLRRALETELRDRYPEIEVRIREDLAGLGSDDRAWYALRDGRIDTGNAAADD